MDIKDCVMDKFITIEGCDGVGKTYHVAKLKEYCLKEGRNDILFTREPGGSVVAEKIRHIILDAENDTMSDLCEAFLYAAARVQHLDDVVIPALKAGKTVICDRFVDSSYVYQGFGRELGYERVRELNAIAIREYMPALTVFLDLSPDKAFQRKGGGNTNDRLEICDSEFYSRVYEGYRYLIAKEPQRFLVVDASGTKAQTHELLINGLRSRGII